MPAPNPGNLSQSNAAALNAGNSMDKKALEKIAAGIKKNYGMLKDRNIPGMPEMPDPANPASMAAFDKALLDSAHLEEGLAAEVLRGDTERAKKVRDFMKDADADAYAVLEHYPAIRSSAVAAVKDNTGDIGFLKGSTIFNAIMGLIQWIFSGFEGGFDGLQKTIANRAVGNATTDFRANMTTKGVPTTVINSISGEFEGEAKRKAGLAPAVDGPGFDLGKVKMDGPSAPVEKPKDVKPDNAVQRLGEHYDKIGENIGKKLKEKIAGQSNFSADDRAKSFALVDNAIPKLTQNAKTMALARAKDGKGLEPDEFSKDVVLKTFQDMRSDPNSALTERQQIKIDLMIKELESGATLKDLRKKIATTDIVGKNGVKLEVGDSELLRVLQEDLGGANHNTTREILSVVNPAAISEPINTGVDKDERPAATPSTKALDKEMFGKMADAMKDKTVKELGQPLNAEQEKKFQDAKDIFIETASMLAENKNLGNAKEYEAYVKQVVAGMKKAMGDDTANTPEGKLLLNRMQKTLEENRAMVAAAVMEGKAPTGDIVVPELGAEFKKQTIRDSIHAGLIQNTQSLNYAALKTSINPDAIADQAGKRLVELNLEQKPENAEKVKTELFNALTSIPDLEVRMKFAETIADQYTKSPAKPTVPPRDMIEKMTREQMNDAVNNFRRVATDVAKSQAPRIRGRLVPGPVERSTDQTIDSLIDKAVDQIAGRVDKGNLGAAVSDAILEAADAKYNGRSFYQLNAEEKKNAVRDKLDKKLKDHNTYVGIFPMDIHIELGPVGVGRFSRNLGPIDIKTMSSDIVKNEVVDWLRDKIIDSMPLAAAPTPQTDAMAVALSQYRDPGFKPASNDDPARIAPPSTLNALAGSREASV